MAFALLTVTALLGGHLLPVGDFPDHTPYLGLDWLILDLLGSTLLFVLLERLLPLDGEKPFFRTEWQTDFQHSQVAQQTFPFTCNGKQHPSA